MYLNKSKPFQVESLGRAGSLVSVSHFRDLQLKPWLDGVFWLKLIPAVICGSQQ